MEGRCFSVLPFLDLVFIYLEADKKTLRSPWLGNTHNIFNEVPTNNMSSLTGRRLISCPIQTRQKDAGKHLILFIALTLLPKRTFPFDHLADNILQSTFFHKSKGVQIVEMRWETKTNSASFNAGLERQKSKNLNKISFSYMSGMHVKMINILANCQATVKLWCGIRALSNCAQTQMIFASRVLKAANQTLLLHRDAASLAEQRL